MKKYLFLAVCCMLATGFTACSDDDDNEGGGSGTPANNAPNVSESLGIEHLVTSTYGGEGGNATFNYSNGKMTNGVTDGNTNFVITENPLKINLSYISEYNTSISNITDIKTNSNGFVTYAKSKTEETYYEETDSYEESITFEYDADGHLIKQVVTETGDGYSYFYPITYTWVNGNLTKIVSIDEDEEYSYTSTYEFEYASDASVNVNPGIFFDGMYDEYLYDFMWYAALLGKTTKNIPTKITRKSIEKENGEVTYESKSEETVDVTYNPNGSVESITYTDVDYGYPSTVYYGYNGEQLESNIQAGISSKTIKSPRKMRHHRK